MEKIILIGGGGHCKVVKESIIRAGTFEIVGIIDKKETVGTYLDGTEVIGTDDEIEKFYEMGIKNAFITLGSIGSTSVRRKLYNMIKEKGFTIPSVLHDKAIVSKDLIIEEGVFIGAGSIVNSGTKILKNTIINTRAIIEHDCLIGEFVHISPGTILCGGVEVGNDSHIGAGSIVIQNRKIGENTIIGAGSVVVKDIAPKSKAYGNPCRIVKNEVKNVKKSIYNSRSRC